MTAILLVGAGGFLGANVRFAIATWSRRRYGPRFPLGTLIANVAGSFTIGLLMGILADWLADDHDLRLLLVVGFLGAETTFSTFALETMALARRGDRDKALVNVAATAFASLAAAGAGLALASLLSDLA